MHFDPHLTRNFKTNTTLSFVYRQSHPHLRYQDFLVNAMTTISLRTDKPPFNDVRVRRAISQAIDRQAIIEAVYMRGEPSPAVPRGLAQWSLPIDQLGVGAKYYQYNPKEARRLLAEAGYARALKTSLTTTGSWQPYVQNYAPNLTFDYGSRVAALWLER